MDVKIDAASAWPWIPVAGAIVGVVLGYFLSRIPANRERKRKATGYFRGIDAEIDYAFKRAWIYVNGENGQRVFAPAYRLLTRFSVDGTAWLAGEGFITKTEIEALLAYLAAAEEFNRCLNEVDERANERRREVAGRGADDADIEYQTTEFLSRSIAVNRATLKAGNIAKGEPPEGVAVTARAAIRVAANRAGLQLAD